MRIIKIFLLFAVCLLMSRSAYSQSGCPKLTAKSGDCVVSLDATEVRNLNLLKVRYDHLQNQHRWDSTEIATYVQLSANMTEQLNLKNEILSDQEHRIGIYKDIALNSQGQADKNILKLTKVKTQRNILGSAGIVLCGVIAGILYFRH